MRWFCALLVGLGLVATALISSAGDRPVVTTMVQPGQVVVAPGKTFKLNLVLNVATKFHINGPSAGEAGLIPTKVDLTAPAGLTFQDPAYPKAKQVRVQFADQPVDMYSGRVVIGLTGRAAADMKPGAYKVEALVSYQACDDLVCHMPFKQELSFVVRVSAQP